MAQGLDFQGMHEGDVTQVQFLLFEHELPPRSRLALLWPDEVP